MKMYFYSKSSEKIGPLTFEELIKKNLTEKVLVWSDGLTNWIPAGELDELKEYVIKEPPPLPSEKREYKIVEPDLKYDKTYKRNYLSIAILIITILTAYPISIIIGNLLNISINKVFRIVAILIGIVSFILTVLKSDDLNRSTYFGGILGLFLPVTFSY